MKPLNPRIDLKREIKYHDIEKSCPNDKAAIVNIPLTPPKNVLKIS